MKVKYIITLCFLVFSTCLFGQTRVLKEKVDTVSHLAKEDSSNFGANKSHFITSYIGLGLPINQYQEGAWQYRGVSYDFGIYYKLRLGSVFSLVYDLNYSRIMNSFYTFNDLTNRDLPIYKYRRAISNLGITGLGIRLNLDSKRGNSLGKYIEIRAKGAYLASFSSKSKMELTAFRNTFIISDKTSIKSIDFEDRLFYGADILVGSGSLALKLGYIANAERLPTLFSDSPYALPTYTIGLQIGFSN